MKKKKLATLLITALLLVNESAVALAEVNENINEVEENIILDEEISQEENLYLEENDNIVSEEDIIKEQTNDENEIEINIGNEEKLDGIETYANENSTKGTAKNISLNVSNTFSIKGSYEGMWAKFILPSDGYITINLDKVLMGQSQEKTMYLKLEDESGKVVYLETNSEDGGDYGSTVNKWTIGLGEGTYYLKLAASFSINLNQYDLKYKVDYIKDSNFEKEKNDSISTANVIELNKTYKAILNEEGVSWGYHKDYYAVDIKNSNFVLKVKHNIDSKYKYYIYDSYGNNIDYIYESSMEYENGGIYKYTLKNLVPGRYYIKLENDNSVSKDPYEITISEVKNGWITEDGKTYYYNLGNKVIGLETIDGQTYYFDNSGVMKTGWISTSGYWYYFNPNTGAMHKGWLKSGSSWYYLDSTSGMMLTGSIYIGNDLYCFNKDGVMQSSKWYNDYGSWYYLKSSGAAYKGWLKEGSKWYYLDSASGIMVTGSIYIGDNLYCFNKDGVMQSGKWYNNYGTWYYLKSSGVAYKGWLKEGSKWYYLDDYNGEMATGATNVRGVMYLFNESGVMNTSNGWKKIYETYYYANSNGKLKTGWLKDNGKWYYLNNYGAMATYDYTVGGVTYYFGKDGAMRTGWQYLYDYGFYRSYYFYFGNDGAMRTGWQTINGITYYFIDNSNDAPRGSMATGWWRIDGILYYFDIDGEFIY